MAIPSASTTPALLVTSHESSTVRIGVAHRRYPNARRQLVAHLCARVELQRLRNVPRTGTRQRAENCTRNECARPHPGGDQVAGLGEPPTVARRMGEQLQIVGRAHARHPRLVPDRQLFPRLVDPGHRTEVVPRNPAILRRQPASLLVNSRLAAARRTSSQRRRGSGPGSWTRARCGGSIGLAGRSRPRWRAPVRHSARYRRRPGAWNGPAPGSGHSGLC